MKSVLLLCNRPHEGANAQTISEHLDSLCRLPECRVFELSTVKTLPVRLDLEQFDAIIIHYTLQLGEFYGHFLGSDARKRIADFKGVKIAFIQDEYREINRVRTALSTMKVDLLYTLLSKNDCELVYPKELLPGLMVRRVLAGYVNTALNSRFSIDYEKRNVDIGYRGRKYPMWLGRLTWEKYFLTEKLALLAAEAGFSVDISNDERMRLYGEDWYQFLSTCKVVVGTESGANIVDYDGTLRERIEEFVIENPNAAFEVVSKLFLEHVDDTLSMNQISPRHFEAISFGTAQVLFEGSYSGILIPGRHYIEVKKDFSNLDFVFTAIRSGEVLKVIAQTAYDEIACNPEYSYAHFSEFVSHDLVELCSKKFEPRSSSVELTQAKFRYLCFTSYNYAFSWLTTKAGQGALRFRFIRAIAFSIWDSLPASLRRPLRPFLALIGR